MINLNVSNISSNLTRKDYIDVSKAVAMFLVVMGHVSCYSLYHFDYTLRQEVSDFIYSFHMPLFLFLSGLVAPFRDMSLKEIGLDCVKRIRSLLVPFFIIGTLYVLFIRTNISGLYMSNFKLGYWYLWVLFELYLVNYLIVLCCKLSSRWYYVLFYGICAWLVLRGIRDNIPETIGDVLSIHLLTNYFPFFFAGCWLHRYDWDERIFSNKYLVITLVILAPLLYTLRSYGILEPFPHINRLVTWVEVFATICLIFMVSSANNKVTSILCTIGRKTLFIYVLHYFVIYYINLSILGDFIQNHYSFGLEISVITCVSIIIFAITYSLVKLITKNKYIMRYVFNMDSNKFTNK